MSLVDIVAHIQDIIEEFGDKEKICLERERFNEIFESLIGLDPTLFLDDWEKKEILKLIGSAIHNADNFITQNKFPSSTVKNMYIEYHEKMIDLTGKLDKHWGKEIDIKEYLEE